MKISKTLHSKYKTDPIISDNQKFVYQSDKNKEISGPFYKKTRETKYFYNT